MHPYLETRWLRNLYVLQSPVTAKMRTLQSGHYEEHFCDIFLKFLISGSGDVALKYILTTA